MAMRSAVRRERSSAESLATGVCASQRATASRRACTGLRLFSSTCAEARISSAVSTFIGIVELRRVRCPYLICSKELHKPTGAAVPAWVKVTRCSIAIEHGRTRQRPSLLGQVVLEAYGAVRAHRNLPVNDVDGGIGRLTAADTRRGRLAGEVGIAAHGLSLLRARH